MTHNFIWDSKKVTNCPECLFCGCEIVNGMLNIINIKPGRKEYLMSEDRVSSGVTAETITADWFKAEVKTEGNNTYLFLTICDPAESQSATDRDFINSSNLQILDDGTHKYLEMRIHRSILDESANYYAYYR